MVKPTNMLKILLAALISLLLFGSVAAAVEKSISGPSLPQPLLQVRGPQAEALQTESRQVVDATASTDLRIGNVVIPASIEMGTTLTATFDVENVASYVARDVTATLIVGDATSQATTPFIVFTSSIHPTTLSFRPDVSVGNHPVKIKVEWTNGTANFENTHTTSLAVVNIKAPSDLEVSYSNTQQVPNTVIVSWTDNSAIESGVEVWRNDGTGWLKIGSAAANAQAYNDRAIPIGKDYTYKIRSYQNLGNDNYRFSDFVTSSAISLKAPDKPTLTATAASPTEIRLSWNDVAGETNYVLDKKANESWQALATVDKDVTTYSISNLTESTAYTYRLKATNVFGDSEASEASATTFEETFIVSASIDDANPGEEAEIKITITNHNDYAAEDLSGRLIIEDLNIDEELELDEDDLARGASEQVSIDVDIPESATADEYDVSVELTWEDPEDTDEELTDDFDVGKLEITTPTHAIQITNAHASHTKINAGNELQVIFTLKNAGSRDESVVLRLSNEELGSSIMQLRLDDGESVTDKISLEIPEDAETGTYAVTLAANYANEKVEQDITISVRGEAQPSGAVQQSVSGDEEPEIPASWLWGAVIVLAGILVVLATLRGSSPAVAQQY